MTRISDQISTILELLPTIFNNEWENLSINKETVERHLSKRNGERIPMTSKFWKYLEFSD